jgi:hypothetical protein
VVGPGTRVEIDRYANLVVTFVSRYGFGFDIGGTFTDFVLIDGQTGDVQSYKTLTTPQNPSEAVMEGWRELLARVGATGADVATAIHGTTLITNAFIERKGAVTLLVTTRGFADVLDTQREMRYDIYDLHGGRCRTWCRASCASRSTSAWTPSATSSGLPIRRPRGHAAELDEAGVTQRRRAPSRCPSSTRSRTPRTRRQARDWLHATCRTSVSISSEVAPQIREYERMSTTVANAYVQPLTERYLAAIRTTCAAGGFRHDLYLMLSSGGITTVDTAARFPVRLTESRTRRRRPRRRLLRQAHRQRDLVSFDMGGTTAKMCLIRDGEPSMSDTFEIARVRRFKRGSGLPVRIPTIELIEIGAGGGSIARVDELGLLKVGPDSSRRRTRTRLLRPRRHPPHRHRRRRRARLPQPRLLPRRPHGARPRGGAAAIRPTSPNRWGSTSPTPPTASTAS